MLAYLARLSVSMKLTVCFGVMLVALAWTGWQGDRSAQSTRATLEANAETMKLAGDLGFRRALVGVSIRDAIILVDPVKMKAAEDRADERNQKFRQELAQFEARLTLPESKRDVEDTKRLYERYWADMREATAASPSGASAGPARMLDALDKGAATASEIEAKIEAAIFAEEKAGRANAEAQFESNRIILLGSTFLSIAFAVLALWYVKRRVATPLVEVSLAAAAIARGDTTQKVEFRSEDEIGVLAESMRGVIDFVGSVAKAAQAMARGDLDVEVKKRSDVDILSGSVIDATRSLRTLVQSARSMTEAAQTGELGVRGDTTGLDGAYGDLVRGLNATMDAFNAPMSELKDVLAAVAEKDLTSRMTGDYAGDYATIKDALDRALTNMETTLDSVVSSAQQVATAATEISSGSQSLSQAATEQASSLEEVTSSLQEITSMSKQNAGSAQQARAMAVSAAEGAQGGGRSMAQLSDAVVVIKQHADQTAKIVKTIDDIAFQTNLLALNAAVEAARAGDAGKGFAVVAEEVRNLAMRCAEAAKTTSHLIEESVKSSELGVQLNAVASQHFTAITEKVGRIVEVIGEIAAASEHQSRGVSQINTAVDEMSRVTQHNAATTEESAAACEELSSQASSMQEMAGSFQLSSNGGGRAPRKAPAGALRRQAPPPLKAQVRHLRSVPPPRITAKTGTDNESLFPLDDDDGLQQF